MRKDAYNPSYDYDYEEEKDRRERRKENAIDAAFILIAIAALGYLFWA